MDSRIIQDDNVINLDEEVDASAQELAPGETLELADGSVRYRLLYPRKLSRTVDNAKTEEVLSEVIIKRPNGGDIRRINKVKDPLEASVMAFNVLTGQPPVVFDKLDAKDINKISAVTNGFVGESP